MYKYYIIMTTGQNNTDSYFYFMRIKEKQNPMAVAARIVEDWDKPFRRADLFQTIVPTARIMQISTLPQPALYLMNEVSIYSTAIPTELVWTGLTRKEMYDAVMNWYSQYVEEPAKENP